MSDTIYREEAIKALRECVNYVFSAYDGEKKISLDEAIYRMRRLTSASAEIIRCKDCAYGEQRPDRIACELHDYLPFDNDDFCSMGVKRVTGY